MSSETNKAILQRMTQELWNEGRIDLVEEYFTEDYVEHIAGMPPSTGYESVRGAITMTRNAYPDFSLRIDDVLAEGNKVALRWTMTGTHKAELFGIPATGKQVSQSGTTFYGLENGRVAELWVLADMMGLMQQLGVIPAPAAA